MSGKHSYIVIVVFQNKDALFVEKAKNAYEAALPNHTIRMEATLNGKNVVIQIRDTGCGIPPEHLATIFQPFVTYKKDGTGLGLSICEQIVKAHGGTISVESTFGQGTCFTVIL